MTISLSNTVYIDLEVRKNDYFNFPFQVLDDNSNPVDYSAYISAKLSIRSSENASSALLSFSSTGGTYTIDIAGIAQGNFVVECDQFPLDAGSYLYDFEIRSTTRRVTPLSGKITVSQDITQ